MPVDFKIKSTTILTEIDTAFDVDLDFQYTIRPGQPSEIDETRDEDNVMVDNSEGASYTKIAWIPDDHLVFLQPNPGVWLANNWWSEVKHSDVFVESTEHFVIDIYSNDSDMTTPSTPTTGSLDVYIIMDCEVL